MDSATERMCILGNGAMATACSIILAQRKKQGRGLFFHRGEY
jgi:hypothetical protein